MSLEDYLRHHYAATTVRIYSFEIGRHLERIGGEAAALQVSYPDLVRELATLRERYAGRPGTVHRILAAIKAYYRYLVESGQRADFPGSRLRLRDRAAVHRTQVQDLLTGKELQRLLEPRPERYALLATRNRVILGLLVHQALTLREIGRLKVDDVDLRAATLRVAGQERRRARVLSLEAAQVMLLHDYLRGGRPRLLKEETDHLLLTSRGTPERGEGVHYLIETLRPLVSGKRLTPTTIRQSVLAGKLKEGADLRKVQAFAGHRKISTTEGYRETDLAVLRRAVVRFHPPDNYAKH